MNAPETDTAKLALANNQRLPAYITLLRPQSLASCEAQSPQERESLVQALGVFLEALSLPAVSAAKKITGVLERLPVPEQDKLTDIHSGGALAGSEAADYDRFFGVEHVDAPTPATIIVRSLLLSAAAFFDLASRMDSFDTEQLSVQCEGFEAYAELLVRTLKHQD